MLLVVPQYTVWTYALVWLISERHWEATAAGLIVTVAQILGAFGRMGVGFWSDVVGSRMRPLRWVAVAGGVSMAALAVTDALDSPLAIAALLAASVATVAPNGLAFTAVAEIAGPFWGGRGARRPEHRSVRRGLDRSPGVRRTDRNRRLPGDFRDSRGDFRPPRYH